MKNSEINKTETFDPKSFSMSREAISHFRDSLLNSNPNLGIRFSVEEASGCSG